MTVSSIQFRYDTHYTEGQKISFKKLDIDMAGLLFLPDGFDESRRYPAIVLTHPGGGVKEQCSSLYAWNLARAGYVALCFDASYQGESGGLPRYQEDPTSRVEDIRSAVDYLVSLPYVDEEAIGAAGVCAGGGYSLSAAQSEYRIKAVAGISAWNVGQSARKGFPGLYDPAWFQKNLEACAQQRTREARGEPPAYLQYLPELDEVRPDMAVITQEASEYYRTSRCGYPTSVNKFLVSSLDKMLTWDAFAYIGTVSPRPVLLIVGSKADTRYFSEKAYELAEEPKELYVIEGATHVDLYDVPQYTAQVVDKLVAYFDRYLKKQ